MNRKDAATDWIFDRVQRTVSKALHMLNDELEYELSGIAPEVKRMVHNFALFELVCIVNTAVNLADASVEEFDEFSAMKQKEFVPFVQLCARVRAFQPANGAEEPDESKPVVFQKNASRN